ncbi:MAG: AbrB/MazE/SpoVT family DNA-binding domain-containing protein, partial [Clostridia bacterium]|nr:AbrB/MazE/SpoVT family DNA-binding domain-containing protein [Clostridia bacterium]
MKSTGITRQIDSAGRIVLPKELRTVLDLKENRDYLEIFTQNDCIILRKYS